MHMHKHMLSAVCSVSFLSNIQAVKCCVWQIGDACTRAFAHFRLLADSAELSFDANYAILRVLTALSSLAERYPPSPPSAANASQLNQFNLNGQHQHPKPYVPKH